MFIFFFSCQVSRDRHRLHDSDQSQHVGACVQHLRQVRVRCGTAHGGRRHLQDPQVWRKQRMEWRGYQLRMWVWRHISFLSSFWRIRWSCPWNSDQNCKQSCARGWWGQGVKVKSLKLDIAERTRNCESLLLKMTPLNIFVENHRKWNSLGNTICVMSILITTSDDVIW